MGSENWRRGGTHEGQLVYIRNADNGRVGHCWMKGRLREGDIAMVTRHSGDCFWTYNLVQVSSNALQLHDGASFGAYTMGVPLNFELTTKQFHKLMSGECLIFRSDEEPVPEIQALREAIAAAAAPAPLEERTGVDE